ncbi:putative pentatricopeptide repeat-containing protein At3g11460, mitochondrial [Malania oleifera]|uniref:putative pentatricopeptide repeat-containing protein At3g11460, mitochondrial n=1 Tax=Malania oleifera TaxID=397392 RepID=UPI0025ADF17D|nr:putative pentatricopeptide repeat-containing protein At3g11460, mitochondrial [Malania oleifera]
MGQIAAARSLFATLFEPSIRLLNYTLKELSHERLFEKILDLYFLLRLSNAKADNFTYPFVLKACSALRASDEGKLVHNQIAKSGFVHNIVVANSLIDLYSKIGSLESAHEVFDEMLTRNVISWNCMISGCVNNGFLGAALELCSLMEFEGMRIDEVTLRTILPSCGLVGALFLGESLHARAIVLGFSPEDTVVLTSIMDMYAKCGIMDDAQKLFIGTPHKDAVTWNVLIGGYSQKGQLDVVLKLFRKMQAENVKPTIVTLLISLQTCADIGSLQTGETMHSYITKIGINSDASVEALLIKLYSKCGKLDMASSVFRTITCQNVNSWSAIIYGLGMHGFGEAALMSFFNMLKRGIDPDSVCFLLVLSSCSHLGLVHEGYKVFNYMVRQFGIKLEMKHYATMIDLIGRAGFMEEAFEFIEQMPKEPDISAWGALLGACKMHGDFKVGHLEKRVAQLHPRTAGYRKLLLGIYASKGRWDEVFTIRSLISKKGVQRLVGHSLVEVNG